MRTKLLQACSAVALGLLVSTAAEAYSITFTYEGQDLITVEEGETLTVPPFNSLDPTIQSIIVALGYHDTYLKFEGTSLTVPTGCLDDDITIDIGLADVPGAVVALSFEVEGFPDGFNFSCLPELVLPYGECLDKVDDESVLTVAYYDGGGFTTAGIANVSVDTDAKTVAANIPHMSVIVLTDQEGAGGSGVPALGLPGIIACAAALGLAGLVGLMRRRSVT